MNETGSCLELADGSLFFEQAGEGDPVVFLHGFGLDSRMWNPQRERLRTRYRVLTYDLRGFGRSSLPPAGSYSHEEDLRALLLHLGVVRAHVVGLSMGGGFVLRFAAAYPEMVRSLILADSALDGYGWSADWLSRWRKICVEAREGRIVGARRLWLEHPLFASARADSSCAALLDTMIGDYSGWHWKNKDTATLSSPPLIERLREIRLPSLVITGALDLPDFQAIAEILERNLPIVQRRKIPSSGHMVNLEAPGAFNDALEEFWQSVR